jgi:hypothetical protein
MAEETTPLPSLVLMHPNPVTAADVVGWFRDAIKRGPAPDESMVGGLLAYVNVGGTPIYLSPLPTDNSINEIHLAVSNALATLREKLPPMLEVWEARHAEGIEQNHRPGTVDRQVRCLRALKIAVDAANEGFGYTPSAPTTTRGMHHGVVRTVGMFVWSAMLRAGHAEVKFTKHDGPAIKVVQRAMAHIEGFQREGTALVEVLKKMKVGKIETPLPT